MVDRVAQTAAVPELEPEVEKVCHDDSCGYCPGRSPVDAVGVCRRRVFQEELSRRRDVKAFFGSVPWDLMFKAVTRHTIQRWVRLYVERWLKAPMRMPDGAPTHRMKGTVRSHH